MDGCYQKFIVCGQFFLSLFFVGLLYLNAEKKGMAMRIPFSCKYQLLNKVMDKQSFSIKVKKISFCLFVCSCFCLSNTCEGERKGI